MSVLKSFENTKNEEKNQKHFTHNTFNSSLSSHNYLLLNESKRSSIKKESEEEIKPNINNIQLNKVNNLNIKGTLKIDKVHYIMKEEGQKLFEDINLQYIEPLEGGEEDSEEPDDATYRKYLNNVKEELNQKKENIVFVHDLALSNNKLNINDLFDKIKKKSRMKTRNSFLSVYRPKKEEEIIPNINVLQPKKIIPKRRAWGFKAIKNLFVSKIELKQYLKSGSRVLTFDNRKNINNYYKIKHTLLNIRERKKAVRKINSQKIFKKVKKGQILDDSEDDVFGNKKKNKIKDSLSLLDSSKKTSKIEEGNKKEEEKPKEEVKEEEKKDETDEKIKKLSPKHRKKKKNIPAINQKKKITQKKNKDYLKRNQIFKTKNTSPIGISKLNIDNNKGKLKSPAINSILRDIKDLSQAILTNRIRNHKEKKNRKILYDKHFGYEYWKENEIRKFLCHNSTTNRKSKSLRSFYSPSKDPDTFSVMSSNFSWLFNQKNGDDLPDYDTDFTSGIREKSQNPYSINWTKSLIQNSYNRNIKLRNNNKGVPRIELVRKQSSTPYTNRERVTYDKSKNANELFRKTNNMFGRIYKNNEIEFPVIKNF